MAMNRIIVALLAAAAGLCPAAARAANPFAGRWDLTVKTPTVTYPSWVEVVEKDGELAVRAQTRTGNVRPVSGARMDGSRLIVTVSAATPAQPASEGKRERPAQPAFVWELEAKGGKLTGIQKRGDTVQGQITGVRAPELKRAAPKAWTAPEPLFNGKDLTGWITANNTDDPGATQNHWVAKNGELVNEAKGHNIISTRKFNDFKLHVEFNIDPGSNSGIYLRGRYEVQMPPPGAPRPSSSPRKGGGPPGPPFGYAIYGAVPASREAPGNPGEWRSYDITLVGRYVTLAVNGVTIVDNQEIPCITGGALDSNEGEPGPIYFQGDHTGGIRYRNITISVPKR